MIVLLVILVSLLSAVSRAALNVFDRSALRQQNVSVLDVSFLNNALPLLMLLPVLFIFDASIWIEVILDIKTWLLAASVQMNALVFGYAFKKMTVPEVGIWSKLPDLFSPFGFHLIGITVLLVDFLFSLVTSVFLIAMLILSAERRSVRMSKPAFLVFVAVLFHSLLSSVLIISATSDFKDALALASCIVFMRCIYSLILLVPRLLFRARWTAPMSLLVPRAFFAVTTQVTFVWALSFGNPVLSWSIFNMTSILASVISSMTIGERPSRVEFTAIAALSVFGFLRLHW